MSAATRAQHGPRVRARQALSGSASTDERHAMAKHAVVAHAELSLRASPPPSLAESTGKIPLGMRALKPCFQRRDMVARRPCQLQDRSPLLSFGLSSLRRLWRKRGGGTNKIILCTADNCELPRPK